MNQQTQALSDDLLKHQALQRIWESEDFKKYLLPSLTQVNKWLDPQSFDSNEVFQRAYNVLWARAKVSEEIITLLSSAQSRADETLKRVNKKKAKDVKSTKFTKNRP